MAATILDVVDAVRMGLDDCLAPECRYQILSTMGDPPAECNLIAVYPDLSTRSTSSAASNRCRSTRIETIKIVLNHECQAIDGGIEWDFQREHDEMRCLLDDVQRIEECLQCNLIDWLKPHVHCSPDETFVAEVDFDQMRVGGSYRVTWAIRLQRGVCCPPEE